MIRLVAAIVGLLAASMSAAQPEPRLVFSQPGLPIRNQLEPGDTRIVLEMGIAPLQGYIPGFIPPDELLRGNANHADTVATVRIESRVSKLTPDGSSIVTTTRARVIEGFKPRTLSRGQYVDFEQAGGDIELDGVSVQATAEWETNFKIGETYLLFIEGTAPQAWVHWSYRITARQTLESLFIGFLEEGEADTGHGLPLSRARVYLKQAR